MRTLLVIALMLFACKKEGVTPASGAAPSGRTWNFDGGAPPLSGGAGTWKVRPPGVLVQEAASDESVFNIALLDGTSFQDLEMSVKLKAVSGQVDEGGGLVWRARDARNYYIARFNPLEDNFRVYKVVDGVRTQLGSVKAPPTPGWHVLRVRMKGDAIECELDGKIRLEAKDATFTGAGRIGLWTKADAVTEFDDLTVK